MARLLEEARNAFNAGQRELCRRRYESVLYLLRSSDESSIATDALRGIGRAYVDDGDFDAAADCLAMAQAIAELNGDTAGLARITNVLAIGQWQRGELDEAERLYLRAGFLAREARDEMLAAMVEQNLGIIANMRGDVERALGHYTTSLTAYRSLGLDDYIAKLLANIGLALADLGRWEEAERTYLEALALCASAGDVPTSLMIEVNRVETQLARGQLPEARAICERVLRRAEPLNDVRAIAEAHKNLGVIAREQGRLDEAETLLRFAFTSASARQDLLLAAETAREQAELYSTQRRNRDTLHALNTSHRLFTQLRAQRDLADVKKRTRRLERRFAAIVLDWAQSIEAKDPYTQGHCERVAAYADAIAMQLGAFDSQAMFWFHIGAVLHDVGKIAVPLEVLNKPGALTPEERAIMEYHPQAGEELLRGIDFPWDVVPMVRSHHERWDGRGYPDRLVGEAIPLAARILSIADVYDALTTDRPYRRAFTRDEALEIMTRDAGRAFDAEIFASFLHVVPQFPALEPLGMLDHRAA